MLTARLALLAVAISAVAVIAYPDPLFHFRRQAPGTPAYDCHANCGGVITMGRTDNYCASSNFTTSLENCLGCALQFDIWQYYGDGVTAAAAKCGLDATPIAANATTASSSTVSGSAQATVAATTSTPASEETTSAVASSAASATTKPASSSEGGAGTPTASLTSSGSPSAAASGVAGGRVAIAGGLAMLPFGVIFGELL